MFNKSSDDRIKKNEDSQIKVPIFPNVMQWKQYVQKIKSRLCVASAYGDDKET